MRITNLTINRRPWMMDISSSDSEQRVDTDEVLLRFYAQGDAAAFECLYLRHKKALFSFLRRQCSNTQIAEELSHDVWLAIIKQSNSFQADASFKTWMYRIAHNRLVDYWRKHGRSAQSLLAQISQCELTQDRSSESVEITQLLSQLEQLSDEQTTAMLLKIEGFSQAEIAQITHAKQETVKSRLRYATQRLRVAMELT